MQIGGNIFELTSQKMALQVLRVQVGLVTVRARELSVSILSRDGSVLRATINAVADGSSAAGNARENTTAALRAHDLRAWRFLSPVRRAIRAVHVMAHSTPGLTIGVAKSAGRHAVEVATVPWRSGRDGLRVSLRGGRGWQHTRRRGVRLVGLRLKY